MAKAGGKVDKDDLTARTAQRAEFRLHHVGTKLNERELGLLEELVDRRGVTQGELIRGLILAEIDRDLAGVRASAELVEIAACRFMLMNLLKPLATGQPLTEKLFEALLAETKTYKYELAEKLAKEHAAHP